MLYGLCFLFLVRKHHSGRDLGLGQQGVLSSIAGPSYLRRLQNWRGQPALPSPEAVAQQANGSLQSVTAWVQVGVGSNPRAALTSPVAWASY